MFRHAGHELGWITLWILHARDKSEAERAAIFTRRASELNDCPRRRRIADPVPDHRLDQAAMRVRKLELPIWIAVFGELCNARHHARTPLAQRPGLEQRKFHVRESPPSSV